MPILVRVTRIFFALLLALSLIGAPSPALATASHTCAMAGTELGMSVDHEDMDCCATDCTTACAPAGLQGSATELLTAELAAIPLMTGLVPELPSIEPAATDPPPRLRFT